MPSTADHPWNLGLLTLARLALWPALAALLGFLGHWHWLLDYTAADLDYIVPRVLELSYTARDLAPWATDLGHHGPPFAWHPDRRAQLRAELDAWYARLYGLTRDELRYILDPADVMSPDYPSETFRVLKNNEMRQFGEYRTQRLILAAWDTLATQSP